jgi:hypothetical protein
LRVEVNQVKVGRWFDQRDSVIRTDARDIAFAKDLAEGHAQIAGDV